MKNLLKSGMMAICVFAIGTVVSCKDAEKTETENMETDISTETMTTAQDTMVSDTITSDEPGTTSGTMEQVP